MKILDNSINNALGEAGLSPSEQVVYLEGAQAPALSSAELIKRTRLPRPTVLAALKALRGYGLCLTHRRDGRSLVYSMKPASALKPYVGERIRQLDDLMERLDTIAEPEGALSVQEVHGQQALQDLLELALRCKSRQWQIISPRDNALAHMPKSYIAYFKKVREERQIQSQTLWDVQWRDSKLQLRDVLMRKPRFIPKNVGQIPTMLLAFDDMLLVVDGTTNPTAALLQSQPVVTTYKLIFELAWRSCREG